MLINNMRLKITILVFILAVGLDQALRHAILCHDPNPIWPEVFPVRKCFYTLWGSLLAPFYVLLDWQLPVRRKLNRVYWYLSLPVISRFMGVMSVNLWNY